MNNRENVCGQSFKKKKKYPGREVVDATSVQRNFGVAKVAQRHAIWPRVYTSNTRVCIGERERKVFARVQTRLRLSAARKYARPRTTRKMTGHDVFELDSTRKYFTRANTRRDGSYRFLLLPRGTARGFSSSFRYVIHQTSKRFRAGLPSGLGLSSRVSTSSNFLYRVVVKFPFCIFFGIRVRQTLSAILPYERYRKFFIFSQ